MPQAFLQAAFATLLQHVARLEKEDRKQHKVRISRDADFVVLRCLAFAKYVMQAIQLAVSVVTSKRAFSAKAVER